MKTKQTGRWMLAALLLALGGTMVRADDLAITSFKKGGNLVFRTSDDGTAEHHYRIESTTSLVSAAWTTVRTASGFGASTHVTNGGSVHCEHGILPRGDNIELGGLFGRTLHGRRHIRQFRRRRLPRDPLRAGG